MTLCLTPDELADLTGRTRNRAQARQLLHMGIPYRERADGTLVVLRIHVESIGATHVATLAHREPQLLP